LPNTNPIYWLRAALASEQWLLAVVDPRQIRDRTGRAAGSVNTSQSSFCEALHAPSRDNGGRDPDSPIDRLRGPSSVL